MPPRKTTDFGALFEAVVEDLRIQVAASIDRTVHEFERRLSRLERCIEHADAFNDAVSDTSSESRASFRRSCALCDRSSVARGLCSAHYQQWRYRERKAPRNIEARTQPIVVPALSTGDLSAQN